jgi:hypothetical protein
LGAGLGNSFHNDPNCIGLQFALFNCPFERRIDPMLTTVTHHLSSNVLPSSLGGTLAYRRTIPRCQIGQHEGQRIDEIMTGASDTSLIIETLPEEWLYTLPASIAMFLRRSAHKGYCPFIPALRRLGLRTRQEIEEQRNAHLRACWRW